MAYWVGGAERPHDATTPTPVQYRTAYINGGKRRVSHGDGENFYNSFHGAPKRPRFETWDVSVDHPHPHFDHGYDSHRSIKPDIMDGRSFDSNTPSFIIIRERSPTPDPVPLDAGIKTTDACSMERTESGLSISSDTTQHSSDDEDDETLITDFAAARLVREHVATFRRRCPDSRHGRILKALINPKSRGAEFPLDDDALQSIFSAANELFFANELARRVTWDWSHEGSVQYQSHIVGTTALRRSAAGGYETLIVLSSPILKDTKYNRRLLISTFLHEMIHSFLFVTCGLKARRCGGHTEGFRMIAEIIDEWAGKEHLRLSEMDADLDRFRGDMLQPKEESATHDQHTRGRERTQRRAVPPQEEWHGHFMEPQPQRRPDHEQWQWHSQEGFRARSTHGAGSPSYVY